MKTTLLKLAGPMQAWGTSSKFETRYTDYYPSKSGIIGLIAASMGLKRNDKNIEELNKIDFAVRIDQEGKMLRDYHIAAKYKKNGSLERNYVTNRYYLEDAVFVVALGCEDEFIEEIYKALKNPYYQLFMGRRSCPVQADFILGLYDEDIMDLIKKYPWQASNNYKKANPFYRANIYSDADLVDGKENIRNDRVITFSQESRKFGIRYETRTYVDMFFENQTDHDIFAKL